MKPVVEWILSKSQRSHSENNKELAHGMAVLENACRKLLLRTDWLFSENKSSLDIVCVMRNAYYVAFFAKHTMSYCEIEQIRYSHLLESEIRLLHNVLFEKISESEGPYCHISVT